MKRPNLLRHIGDRCALPMPDVIVGLADTGSTLMPTARPFDVDKRLSPIRLWMPR